MKEINPNKIKKSEIVVGVPSYNEADSISNVIKKIDQGLVKYFGDKPAVIINSDNNSSDGTSEIFLKLKTKTSKIYISTPPGVKGKGNNFKNLFLKMKELGASAAMVVDADLKSITPEWVKCLISPIRSGYDYITPVYYRDKYDASITNHLCYPILYGFLRYDIRQPIGGDFGFSNKMVDYWLSLEWTEEVKKFGIDIFMTLNAIKFGGKLGQADLGFKIHKISAPKLDNMFLEVVGSLFQFLSENENLWKKEMEIQKPPLVCSLSKKMEYSMTGGNDEIKKKSFQIDSISWAKEVHRLFNAYRKSADKKTVLISLRSLFFARRNTFIEEIRDKNYDDLEKVIKNEARHMMSY